MADTKLCAASSPTCRQLPTAIQLRILELLPPHDRAVNGRLAFRDAWEALNGPHHCTASLSQPLSPQFAALAQAGCWQERMRLLSFRQKLHLLCTAAASGCEANMDVALGLLRPSVFPELLSSCKTPWRAMRGRTLPDPAVAAVRAGHLHLMPWTARHCPGLVDLRELLTAAAECRSLADLQTVWGAMYDSESPTETSSFQRKLLSQAVLDAAAGSATPDAVAKMEWILGEAGGRCSLQGSTASAAARSGDGARLRWLHGRGCPMEKGVVSSALSHTDLATVQWLVDEVGCELAMEEDLQPTDCRCYLAEAAAASSTDGVAKLLWLSERGVPTVELEAYPLGMLQVAAASAGRINTVRYIQALRENREGMQGTPGREVGAAAAGSGSIPMVEFLRQQGCEFGSRAYEPAAAGGHVHMVRWLAHVAGASAEQANLSRVVSHWRGRAVADSRGLLETVQLVGGVGRSKLWDAPIATRCAAGRGELDLVQYLLQLCPGHRLSWEVLVAAASGGCEAQLEWLVEQPGCLVVPAASRSSPYVSAAGKGDLGTLVALRRLGVPWGAEDVLAAAAEAGAAMPALRWLVEQGAPVGSRERMEAAAEVAGRGPWGLKAEGKAWLLGLAAAAPVDAGQE